MKSCPSCRADVPPAVAVCPFCGARFPDAPPRPGASDPPADAPTDAADAADSALARPVAPRLELPPTPMVVMGGAPAREAQRGGGRRVGGWLIALAAIAAGVAWFIGRPPPFPAAGLSPVLATEPVICGDSADCVVIYLAPWDDASQQTAGMIETLRDAWSDDGPTLEVLVGAGEADAMQRMARAALGSSWIDGDSSVADALEIETVPTWFRVIDGRVAARVDGTYLPLRRQLRGLGLDPAAIPAETTVDEPVAERKVLTGEGAAPAPRAADDEGGDEDDAPADEPAADEPAADAPGEGAPEDDEAE